MAQYFSHTIFSVHLHKYENMNHADLDKINATDINMVVEPIAHMRNCLRANWARPFSRWVMSPM